MSRWCRLCLFVTALGAYAQDWPLDRFSVRYFENTSLSGPSVFETEEASINHRWNDGSPHETLSNDHFSGRWQGSFHFEAGNYRFDVLADQGVRIWVDNALIIESWTTSDGIQDQADVFLDEGYHRIEVAYYEGRGNAMLVFDWQKLETTSPCLAPLNVWCASYFHDQNLSQAYQQNELQAPNQSLQDEVPLEITKQGFSARWQGRFSFEEGVYKFTIEAADGFRLWLDDRLLLDHWQDQAFKTYEISQFISTGEHHLRLEQYRRSGRQSASLNWQRAQTPMTPNTSPLGINIEALNYYSSEWPLLDVMRSAGGWYTQNDTTWNTNEQDKLDLDANGWVRSLPSSDDPNSNYRFIGALLLNGTQGHYPAGRYTILYEGEGNISYQFDAQYREDLSSPGHHIVDVEEPGNGGIYIKIDAINPDNYLRNIRVIMPGFRCENQAYEVCDGCDGECPSFAATYAEQPFHPYFLRDLRQYRTIRYMDFLRTNTSEIAAWEDRPQLSDVRWNTTSGAPLELAIQLANTTQTDMWLNIPTRADDAYIAAMASLVLTQLDPQRNVILEYGNEIWNTVFPAGNWVQEQAIAKWPDDPASGYTKRINYQGWRSAFAAQVWRDIWADQEHRLTVVSGGFAANPWASEQAFSCPMAVRNGETPCNTLLDGFAIAPYFGAYVGRDDLAENVAAWMNHEDGGLTALFEELNQGGLLYDPAIPATPEDGGLNQAIGYIKAAADIASRYNTTMYAYEGGQHLAGTGNQQNNAELTELLTQANRDPRMGELYRRYLQAWRSASGGLFCHFTSVGHYGRFGSWGSKEYQNQSMAVKFEALMEYIDQNPCWWKGCRNDNTNGQVPLISPFFP